MALSNDVIDYKLRRLDGIYQLADAITAGPSSNQWKKFLNDSASATELDANKNISAIGLTGKQLRVYIIPSHGRSLTLENREGILREIIRSDVVVSSYLCFEDLMSLLSETVLSPVSIWNHVQRVRRGMQMLSRELQSEVGQKEKILIVIGPNEKVVCLHQFGRGSVIFETNKTLRGPFTHATLGAMAAGVLAGLSEELTAANAVGLGFRLCEALYKSDVIEKIELLSSKMDDRRMFVTLIENIQVIGGGGPWHGGSPLSGRLVFQLPYWQCCC